MKHLENFHIIEVKYHGPTNFKGSRISLYSPRFKQRVYIDFDYKYAHTFENAQEHLEKKRFNLVGKAESKDGYFILTDTFEPLKK